MTRRALAFIGLIATALAGVAAVGKDRIKVAITESTNDVVKGICGATGIGAGFYLSLQNVEAWLRIFSLLVGIAVGLITFASIAYSMWRKFKGIEK